ncbi:MAG TPA: phosphoribosylformylglycinamidine synthase subunit PurQ [Candidatus Melainabacteria bacterium]|jgi:phosphoribosylformylglycinamidine synthase subunit PurQ / glutaminase|nr:phosphoribosylformylglycinamidine synthase subunit PurQ [Candidatus Melainabacteria bacterium]HIN63401.1 phosphoribosylformylglycinamidine synthase subunit PurQ [Candidatus Obscuribacterales bacterium]
MKPTAIVLTGDGINCGDETSFALQLAGFDPLLTHTSDLLGNPKLLKDAKLLALPGGFSFGDEIASGKVLAIKLEAALKESLKEFVNEGKLVIGICNGFQCLVQLGLLPESENDGVRLASLSRNSGKKFINRWVQLSVDSKVSCPWLEGLTEFDLPIRHGEGRLSPAKESEDAVKKQAPLRYSIEVNGSFDRISGLTNAKGNVFGLMPHPEAFVRWTQHPSWTRLTSLPDKSPPGLKIFQNAHSMVAN